MKGKYSNIEIKGIVSAVPENKVCNLDYIEKIENRRIKKQVMLTGIENRHVCINGQKASDLAAIAADKLLDLLHWDRNEIDVLIFVTQSPELSRPSTAFIIQKRLGIGKDCLVYDINLGCSGYIGGIETIAAILSATKGRGLLLVGESNALASGDLSTSSLLEGDAASATALEYGPQTSMLFRHYSDGTRANYIYKSFEKPGVMDGNAVLLFGLNEVVDSVKQFHADHHLSASDVDHYIFHQAQKMIVEGVAQGAGLPGEKVLLSSTDYGNTSSASIPLTACLHLNREKETGRKKIFMCGFGIGLSWGIVYCEIDTMNILPLIFSDHVFDDRDMFQI